MKISKIPGLGRFGMFIDGLDLSTVTDEEWMEIGRLHMTSLVTIIRNANCDKERFAELVIKYGDERGTTYLSKKYIKRYRKDMAWIMSQYQKNPDTLDAEDREIYELGLSMTERSKSGVNLGRIAGGYDAQGRANGFFPDGELLWHSNESGQRTTAPGVAFLAVKNVVGSSTGFVTTADWYENVSESLRSELNEMIVLHRFTPGKMTPGLRSEYDRAMSWNMCPDQDNEVPLVIRSPGGIVGLRYTPGTVYRIKGMSESESCRIFDMIDQGVYVDKYIYDHWYQNEGDLLLFDNSITQHRRLGRLDGRVCYRIAHDYTHLQDGPYQPFFQPYYARLYNREIREVIGLAGVKHFKFAPRTWRDWMPFL